MNSTESYIDALEKGLAGKANELDRSGLPSLKEQFRIFQSAYQTIYNILLKKSLIHEDPYQYDMKISEVTIPPEGVFGENEKMDQMSSRCSVFQMQLDFLNNYYQFSADFLNIGRIKRLLALTKYFNFIQFSETSQHLNTRMLAEMVGSVKKGQDSLSAGLVNDSTLHLDKASKEIIKILKDITFIHKEKYKLQMRRVVMPGLTWERDFAVTHKEECTKQIRKKFAEACLDVPFYPELIEEILEEEYANDAENRRGDILKQLEVKEDVQKQGKQAESFKGTLLESIRMMAACSFQLDDSAVKLEENSMLLEAENNSFMTKLKKMFLSIFNAPPSALVYEIEYMDPVTALAKSEKVDFRKFNEDLVKKSKLFQQLSIRTSPTYKRIESATENQVLQFLEKNIEELQVMHRRLGGLDTYFKSEVEKEDRSRLRGIQMELTTLKNTIIKANQKRHEYVAQKEELEQMKKMGIRVDIL